MPTSTFLHPAFAAVAVASALLPVVIHLLHRSRFRREPWAAMGFLFAANRRSARRIQLEQWLLLLTRIAVISGLGLAVARPFFPAAVLGALGRSRSHHVLLIDNSASMQIVDADGQPGAAGAAANDASRFGRAVELCESLIAAAPPGDGISMVSLAAPASAVIDHPAYDRRGVRDQLTRLSPTWQATDIAGGLGVALDIVRRGRADFPPGSQFVYVIGDQPASGWLGQSGDAAGSASAACQIAETASVVIVDPGHPNAANVAVTGLRTTSTLAGAELPIRFEADVSNFGNETVRDATLRLSLDDRIVHRVAIQPIAPGDTTTASANVIVSQAGPHTVSATVVSDAVDAFPRDNVRLLAIDVDDAVPILLVDAHPAPDALNGSAGYLAAALSPGTDRGEHRTFSPRRLSHRELPAEPLDDYAVVALCGVPSLETELWSRLEGFVAAGGGLLVFAGDGVNAADDNERGYRNGAGLLPCAWGETVGEARRTGESSAPAAADAIGFAADAFTHPVLADFTGRTDSSLFQARIERFNRVQLVREGAEVPLHYTDGSPALVLATHGRGSVAVMTTSADMSWTNLPARGDYVSLMVNLCVYLTRGRGASRTCQVGDEVRYPIPATASAFAPHVTGPDRGAHDARVLVNDGVYTAEFGPAEDAGVYTLTLGPQQTTFAVNLDPMESDTRPVNAEALREALECDASIVSADDLRKTILQRHRSSELGDRMLFAVLILLVAESWLAAKWGASR